MIYPIVLYGSPVLRKVAVEIDKDFPNFDKFINDMFETMYISDGVGLAAPQVGKAIRVFVIDGTALSEEDPSLVGFKKAFINAKIIEENGEKWGYTEGCLSLPNIREEVKRHGTIRIQYYDEKFEYHDEVYDGIKARIIQHEYDHLQGTLLIDHVNPLKRKLLKGRLNDIMKGNINVAYKSKIMK